MMYQALIILDPEFVLPNSAIVPFFDIKLTQRKRKRKHKAGKYARYAAPVMRWFVWRRYSSEVWE